MSKAAIVWEGDSKEIISAFPAEVKQTLGFSLRRIQDGKTPACPTRSMSSIGTGVWELKTDDEKTWYRVIYLTRINDVIHVLHCFEKQSTKTDRRDIGMAKARLKAVRERLRNK